jgi:hypothetical protein
MSDDGRSKSFEELRELGLGACQRQHRNGIQRHLHLVCLAHLLLTHHALKAIGAQATRLCRGIPVPPLRARRTTLQRELREDQVECFWLRIRSPRTGTRVRDFLKMAA